MGKTDSPEDSGDSMEGTPPLQFLENPEQILLEKWPLPHNLGRATREQVLHTSGIERPLHVRSWRAEQLKMLQDTRKRVINILEGRHWESKILKEKRDFVHEQKHKRDHAAEQFLKQGNATVSLPEYGDVSAYYTIMEPPAEVQNAKPPIVFIPGIANDLASVAPLTQELALTRKVLVIGQPESQMGQTTEAFADGVEQSDDFSPHARFFTEAIAQLLADEKEIELWGFSAGGPIIVRMLQDDAFNAGVSDVTLVNPSAAVSMSQPKMLQKILGPLAWPFDPINRGIARDGLTMFWKRLPSFLVYGRKKSARTSEGVVDLPPDDRGPKIRTFNAMLEKLRPPFSGYDSMELQNGHKIVVVASTGDWMTNAAKKFRNNTRPEQVTTLVRDGMHNTPMLYPENLLKDVDQIDRG